MQASSPFELGTEQYHEAAMLRLREAQLLYEEEEWVGCIYLAGRAAESLLRAMLWTKTRQQEVGHDLRDMPKRVRMVIGLRKGEDDAFEDAVNELAVVWRNDLRFTGQSRLRSILKMNGRLNRIHGKRVKGDPLKANAKPVLEAAERIVARGEPHARRLATKAD